MPIWITILISILSDPRVQEWILKLFNQLLERLRQRFGDLPEPGSPLFRGAFVERMNLVHKEIPWYMFTRRAAIRRLALASIARVGDVEWHARRGSVPIKGSYRLEANEIP